VTDIPADIVSRLQAATASRSTVLVGVDGQGAAGKTLWAEGLAEALRSIGQAAAIIHFDDFFLPSAERPHGTPEARPIGGDFDWRRLRDEVLLPLRESRVASYGRYDWTSDALAETHQVPAHGVVIVEGVYCIRRELADLYDVRVWVECPHDVRLARGILRDGEAARSRWELDWMPCEERYVHEHNPGEAAHYVVSGDGA
jgi:uridine kinase